MKQRDELKRTFCSKRTSTKNRRVNNIIVVVQCSSGGRVVHGGI